MTDCEQVLGEVSGILAMLVSRAYDDDFDVSVASWYIGLMSGVFMKRGIHLDVPTGTKEERIAEFQRRYDIARESF